MKRLIPLLLILLAFSGTQIVRPAWGEEKEIGGKTGEKGGIYVVGRAFKTAGHSMEGGFKAAGGGIKKGGKATGRAFQKTGHSIKNFFTGETDSNKSK